MPELEIIDYIGKRRVTKEVLDSAFRAAKISLLKSAMILRKHGEISFVKEVPLEDFNLQKGLYYFQMVYYCGNKTSHVLNLNEGDRSEAKLFQGCATSLKIPFVVN